MPTVYLNGVALEEPADDLQVLLVLGVEVFPPLERVELIEPALGRLRLVALQQVGLGRRYFRRGAGELSGGQKEPESFRQVINARRFLKKRYGKIYLRFHEPLSLSRLLRDQGLNIRDISPKEKNTFCRNLGFRIVNAINKETVVTAHGLCACAILNTPKPRFTQAHLKTIVDLYMRYLNTQAAQLADTLLLDQDYAINNALESFVQRKFIESIAKSKDDVATETEYTVNESQRTSLEYYKNNCVAFFIPASFTALEILHLDAFQFAAADIHNGYRFLQHLFKNEFAYDVDLNPEYVVRKTLKIFIDDAVLIPHQTLPDTYNITSAGFRKLKLFAAFLTTYFESYLIVLNHFMWAPPDGLNAKDRLKKIEARGRRMKTRPIFSSVKELKTRKISRKLKFSPSPSTVTSAVCNNVLRWRNKK